MECTSGKVQVSCELCVRSGEINGFRVAGRFRAVYEIITTICKQSVALAFIVPSDLCVIVLSDLCGVPGLLSVVVHCLCYQTGN
jgi:hypothetical protein